MSVITTIVIITIVNHNHQHKCFYCHDDCDHQVDYKTGKQCKKVPHKKCKYVQVDISSVSQALKLIYLLRFPSVEMFLTKSVRRVTRTSVRKRLKRWKPFCVIFSIMTFVLYDDLDPPDWRESDKASMRVAAENSPWWSFLLILILILVLVLNKSWSWSHWSRFGAIYQNNYHNALMRNYSFKA